MGLNFQQLVLRLSDYWARQGCVVQQPYDVEAGAGTMHPDTFFRVLGPEPWRAAYCAPSRRPVDGRYGQNPFRLYRHYQFQVILKPSPPDVQDLYLASLQAFCFSALSAAVALSRLCHFREQRRASAGRERSASNSSAMERYSARARRSRSASRVIVKEPACIR